MRKTSTGIRADGYLEGQLLIAMPSLTDKWFARSVIYMCSHSAEGAMGLIVNHRAPELSVADLLQQLEIEAVEDDPELHAMHVNIGGPVETGRGFVLHSADYVSADSTLRINDNFCLTATLDILKSIAEGEGPERAILALGYSGWAPGQLEREIQTNGWLSCAADPELVFDEPIGARYELALSKLGVDPSHLVSDYGHA
ncbi:MAG: hypothetical protein RLZ98_2377 [Pseudomonadota bacterium]|jgi:putative transcriptional regulator